MEYEFWMFSSEQKFQKAMLSNYGPLSAIMDWGIPKRQMMFFHTNLVTSLSLMLVYALAFTHLLK